MNVRSRRIAAGLLCTMTLNSTLLPPIAAASEMRHVVRERALAITQRVDLFGRDGRIQERFEGTRGFVAKAVRANAFASMDEKEIASARAEVAALKRQTQKSRSKIGESFLNALLAVLDARSAPSAEEYHLRVQDFGVSVVNTEKTDSLGRNGTEKQFWSRGVLKVSIFTVDSDPGSGGPRSDNDNSEPMLEGDTTSVDDVGVAPAEMCDTEFEGEWYHDECMTAEQIDDAFVELVYMESEYDMYSVEMQEEINVFLEYCDQEELDCWNGEYEQYEQPTELHEQLESGASPEEGEIPACIGAGLGYGVLGVGYVLRLVTVRTTLASAALAAAGNAATIAATTATVAIGWAVLGGIAFVGAGLVLASCTGALRMEE